MIAPGEIVRVVNKDEDAFVVTWASRDYVLTPEKEQFIPAEAAICWFGDPRATDIVQALKERNNRGEETGNVQFLPDRMTEVRRLRIKHGAKFGDETSFENVPIPHVEVYTAEGDRVQTVLEDPTGRSVKRALVTVGSDEELRELVAKQQAQIETLMQASGVRHDQEAASEGDLPQDTPVDLVRSGIDDLS